MKDPGVWSIFYITVTIYCLLLYYTVFYDIFDSRGSDMDFEAVMCDRLPCRCYLFARHGAGMLDLI